ncbi:DUF305 domain-containing protein [Patulibacter defluvii]|uniref:DUF305 domain-containing protein n=1 Tax=Patulibacter defluvii TaxID=3095358 RepID=UPI002A75EF20|nr:DUF305 domain-containing protein [Patulibacter sp. DM4]
MTQFPTPRTAALVALALGGSLLVSGCGSSDDGGGGHDGHGGAPAATTAPAPPAADARALAVDRAFVRQMVPHHEMAVAMARTARERSRRPQVDELADAIIRAQEGEIAQLRRIAVDLDLTIPAAGAAGGGHGQHGGGAAGMETMAQDARALGLTMDELGMSMAMDALDTADPVDRAFIDLMIPHHQGAIRMARAQLAGGRDPRLRRISRAIVDAQRAEIAQLNRWRRAWYGAPSPAGGVPPA